MKKEIKKLMRVISSKYRLSNLEIFSDGSGSLKNMKGKELFIFHNYKDMKRKLKELAEELKNVT